MNKVKITADAILAIIRGIFADNDVNPVIDTPGAPKQWIGKRLQEILNVEYFTFKHRPIDTERVIADILAEKGSSSQLAALNTGFCLLYLGELDRLYSKDVDMIGLDATLEYWIQTSKVKLLEQLVEDCNIALSGIRLPVQLGGETRKAVVIFDRPNVIEVREGTSFGECAQVEITVALLLYPDVVSYSDYVVSFTMINETTGEPYQQAVPLSSFAVVNTMTQKGVPYISNLAKVGNVNLSNANSFVLVFDGYNNPFINMVADWTMQKETGDNNQILEMTVTRAGVDYTHEVVISDHQINVNADTNNETHTLKLVTRGLI